MTPEEIVDEFIARVVRLDLDGACELVTDDVEYDNVPMGKSVGPDGIKSVLGVLTGGVQGMEFVVHRQVANGSTVMNERTDRFLVDGSWHGFPVAGVFEVTDDGKISLWRDYFDMGGVNDLLATIGGVGAT